MIKDIEKILQTSFPEKNIKSILNHFGEAVDKFQIGDSEKAIARAGKFIEATIKALYVYCGKTLPRTRKFKVGKIVNELENLSGQFDDTVCILIPRACVFIYDIANNRGARHDPDEIDANEMDAKIAITTISWILSELIRFSDKKNSDIRIASDLVAHLTQTRLPIIEDIDDRIYINSKKIKPRGIGLLILDKLNPKRISREDLHKQILRHGVGENAAAVAMSKLKKMVDIDDEDKWKIRGIGREEAFEILKKLKTLKASQN